VIDPLFSVEGRSAFVTGGGRGIGRSIATALASRGANVAVSDIDKESALATSRQLAELGVRTVGMRTDVTDPEQVREAIDLTIASFGRLDILVNNAGIGVQGLAASQPLEDFKRTFEVDVVGVFNVAQAAYPTLADQGGGVVINLASVASIHVLVDQEHAAYNAAKAAVAMLTRSLAVEWAGVGIRVNAIAPGFILTEMSAADRAANPDRWAHWMTHVPMGRAGEMRELEGAAVFLASDASAYVTGTLIVVDGGYVCL
jgi:NAD(P)-dependent dehydrogenase (short-subunit alcohol dehydrogenase family)